MPQRLRARLSRSHAPVFFLVSALLAVSGFFAWDGSRQANAEASALASQMKAEERIETLGREALEALSLGYYQGHSEWLRGVQARSDAIASAQLRADYATLAFALIILGWALAVGFTAGRAALGYALLWASGFALVIGLWAPILSIVAQKELPVLGLTVIRWESKAIVDTIRALAEAGNWFPAALIALFSILVPVLKLSALLVHFVESWRHITCHGVRWVQHLGKWSMADVFVVAVLVAYLGAGKSDGMHASLQTGLYFFAAYVLLSLAGGVLIHPSAERVRGE